ncbi:MAG: aminotransferase class IV [Bacteroidota bacterium]
MSIIPRNDKCFVNFNEKIISSSQPVFTTSNRSFRYGDGLFESIRIADGKICFIKKHISRLLRSMKIMQMDIPKKFSVNFFFSEINNLAYENGIREGGRVRLTIFRNDGGFYQAKNNKVSFLIETEHLPDKTYKLNENGITIAIYSKVKKIFSPISHLKTNNSIIYILASLWSNEKKVDDSLLLNEQNAVVEATSSNIFLCKKNKLFTPPLQAGCVDGIMRKQIILLAKKEKINVKEKIITPDELIESDEIFLTNAIQGIRWIGCFREKKYDNKMAKKMTAILLWL